MGSGGIQLSDIGGAFSVTGATTIGASASGINIFGSQADISFGGTVAIDSVDGVGLFINESGGTIVFEGAVDIGSAADQGVLVNLFNGELTFSGAVDIHDVGSDGIIIAQSSGRIGFDAPLALDRAGLRGIRIVNNPGDVAFGDVAISDPGENGIEVAGVNGTIAFGNVDISGLGGNTGLNLVGSTSIFTALSLDIAGTGAANSTGIDLSGTLGGSVTIANGGVIQDVDTGVHLGTSRPGTQQANTAFVFGGGSIEGITASLDMRGLNAGSGTYSFGTTTFTGPQLFDATAVVFVGRVSTGAGNGSSVNDLINAGAADDLGLGANTTFVLVGTAAADIIDTDAGGFNLATGQSLVSFANGATVDIGGPPANVTGDNVIPGVAQPDPFGFGSPRLRNELGSTIVLSDANVVSNLVVSSNAAAIDGTGGIAGFTSSGVTIQNAATGLFLNGALGTITVNNMNIQGPVQSGIVLANTGATVNFTGTTTIAGGSNAALLANNFDGTASFADLDIAGGTGTGIAVLNGSGGTLSFAAPSSVSNTGGAAISVGTSTATVTYNGTITQNSAANAVRINALTGGSVTFGGLITANTSGANAIELTSNAGGTINLNGGLNIDTTGGTGFLATGGGTITVAATGGDESITTGTGRAINLDGVVIGAGGVSFDNITTGVAGTTALRFNNVSGGTFSGGNVTVAGTTAGGGIAISNSPATFTFASATIDNADDIGVDLLGANGVVTFGTVDIDGSGVGALLVENNTNGVNINGGIIGGPTGNFGGAAVVGGSGNVTIAADIIGNAAEAVGVDSRTGGTVTFSGDITSDCGCGVIIIDNDAGAAVFTGTLDLSNGSGIEIALNSAGFATSFSGAVNLDDAGVTAGIQIVANDAGSTIDFTGPITIANVATAGIAIGLNDGTVDFGKVEITEVESGAAGIVIGDITGAVTFADLDIALTEDGATGIAFGPNVDTNVTATDFDLTSSSATDTVGVDLVGANGTGTVQLGDASTPFAGGQSATIGGTLANPAGPETGVLFSSSTDVKFIFGDGEGIGDIGSRITAVTPVGHDGTGLPGGAPGTYNFRDVNLVGNTGQLQGPTYFVVDNLGTAGAGTFADPGTIAQAELAGVDVIVMVDSTTGGVSQLIDLSVQTSAGGANTLDLDAGQILIALSRNQFIDVAALGATATGAPDSFSFAGIVSTTVITAPGTIDTVLPKLTTNNGNTVSLAGSAGIQNVLIANTALSGFGIFGSFGIDPVDLIIRGNSTADRSVIAGGGGAISLTDGAGATSLALSGLTLSATSGDVLNIDGSAGAGAMTVTDFSDITLLGGNGEIGGAVLAGLAFDNVDGNAFVAGSAADRIGGYGLLLDDVAGDIAFDTTTIWSETANNPIFGGDTSVGLFARGLAGSNAVFDFGAAAIDVLGDPAAVFTGAAYFQLQAGNRAGFSGTVNINTVNALGIEAEAGGTVFFGSTANTVTTTGQAAIRVSSTGLENMVGGSAEFGAITSSGGMQGIALFNTGSPEVIFNGPVTISNTTQNAIELQTAGAVTFEGAVDINNAQINGVSAVSSTLTFTGGLDIQNTGGFGLAVNGGTLVVSGAAQNNIVSTNGAALELNSVSIGAGGVTFAGVDANGAANGILLTSVTGPGDIDFGAVNLQGITSRGVDVATALGAGVHFDSLTINLNNATAVGLDLNGAALSAAITADDFDLSSASAGTTIAVDLRGTTGMQTVRLGDAAAGGASSSISGVDTGVFLNAATRANFTFGDGGNVAADGDTGSTISANVAINASSAPGGGTYDFEDVNFQASPGLGFGVGRIVFVDSNGATGGGNGSGSSGVNPATLAAATGIATSVDDIYILVNNGAAINASGLPGGTLTLLNGQQVRGFGGGSVNLALTIPAGILLSNNQLTITDPTGNGAATLTSSDGSNVITLGSQNNIIDGFILDGNDGAGVNAGWGIIDSGGATNTLVNNMTIRNFANFGIEITPSTNSTISNVIFSGNTQDMFLNASGTTIQNVTSTGSTGAAAIVLTNTTGTTTLTNVDITSAGVGLLFNNAGGTIDANDVDLKGSGGGLSIQGGAGTFDFDLDSSIDTTGGVAFVLNNNSGSLTYSGSITHAAASQGISIVNHETGAVVFQTGTINISGGGIGISVSDSNSGSVAFNGQTTLSTQGNIAVNLSTNSGGVVSFNAAGSGLDITTTTGTAFSAAGGGTVNVLGAGNSINAGSGTAVVMSGVTANVTFASTTSGGGTNGISLTNVGGTVTLGTGALAGATGTTFDVVGGNANITYSGTVTQAAAGQRLIAVTNTTGGAVTFNTATANGLNNSAATGTGILIDGAAGNVTINNASLTGARGITIEGDSGNNATGSFTFNNVAIDTGAGATNHAILIDGDHGVTTNNDVSAAIAFNNVDIVNPGGNVVNIQGMNGGSVTFDANSSITRNDGGLGIVVDSNSGGTVNFSGTTKTLITGGNSAVSLSNNTGATINFTGGGLDIDTTSGVGFSATGGGTVTVQGSGNTINSVSATALIVQGGTFIGSSGLTFQRIDAGNSTAAADPVNGIVLNNTGTLGGLTVTGVGVTAGSGGTIQNTTGDGVSLTDTQNVSLSNMVISDNAGSGIQGLRVNGVVLNRITLNSNASSNTDAGILFNELIGDATHVTTFSNLVVSNSFTHNVQVINSGGNLTNLVVSASTFSNDGSSNNAGSNFIFEADGAGVAGTPTMKLTVDGSTFTGNNAYPGPGVIPGTGLFVVANDGTVNAHIGETTGNTFNNLNNGINLTQSSNAGLGTGGNLNFTVRNNTVTNSDSTAINVFSSGDLARTLDGIIENNVVGTQGVATSGSRTGFGIRVGHESLGVAKVLINNNTIQSIGVTGTSGGESINISQLVQPGTMHATVTNNIIRDNAESRGITVNATFAGAVINADVRGNTITNVNNANAIRFIADGIGAADGTINLSQASEAALEAANGGATALSDARTFFNQPAPLLPAPTP